MARQRQRNDPFEAPPPPNLDKLVARLVDAHLVKIGLLEARRCATCENWCPIGEHCFKWDAAVPVDVQKKGCDEWLQCVLI